MRWEIKEAETNKQLKKAQSSSAAMPGLSLCDVVGRDKVMAEEIQPQERFFFPPGHQWYEGRDRGANLGRPKPGHRAHLLHTHVTPSHCGVSVFFCLHVSIIKIKQNKQDAIS